MPLFGQIKDQMGCQSVLEQERSDSLAPELATVGITTCPVGVPYVTA